MHEWIGIGLSMNMVTWTLFCTLTYNLESCQIQLGTTYHMWKLVSIDQTHITITQNEFKSAKITSLVSIFHTVWISYFCDLVHTFGIQFHMNLDLTIFPINMGVIFLHFQLSITKKSMPHWNSKEPKNQLTVPLIHVITFKFICPESFTDILWTFSNWNQASRHPELLWPFSPSSTFDLNLDKVVTSKITF